MSQGADDPTRGDEFDPPALPSSSAPLPTFADIPEILRHVLVVDDNAVFRGYVRGLLAAQGLTVYEATDARSGLALALEKRPWLILTDIRMPGEDGFELCRRIRSHSLIQHTPLLFLSGYDDYKSRYHGLELGADDFVSKDTPVRELLIRIQLVLKRYMELGRRGSGGAGMEGQLDVIGAPGVLQVCHLTRLSGVLLTEAAGKQMTIRFREGEIVGASGEGLQGADAIYAFLAWDQGRFHFAPGDFGAGERLGPSFGELVLEGCRRLDEARRAAGSAGPPDPA